MALETEGSFLELSRIFEIEIKKRIPAIPLTIHLSYVSTVRLHGGGERLRRPNQKSDRNHETTIARATIVLREMMMHHHRSRGEEGDLSD